MTAKLTIVEIDALLTVAAKHQVLELSYRGLTVRRLPDTAPARAAAKETDAEWLARQPPDSIDAALMLRRTKGGV